MTERNEENVIGDAVAGSERERLSVLLTGAGGMLGRYLRRSFASHRVTTLGLREGNDIVCDLRRETPQLGGRRFDIVIHAAGTEGEEDALELNHAGTKRLIQALRGSEPKYFIYISSFRVYGDREGHGLDEETRLWATSKAGQSKALAEKEIADLLDPAVTTVTILRPALMFGSGVGGEMLDLFREVNGGRYIHVRGNDARRSVVTALDVAAAAARVYRKGGVYNVADGHDSTFLGLVEAMSANAGSRKRPVHLPPKWVSLACRAASPFPPLRRIFDAARFERRSLDATYSPARLKEATGMEFYDTLKVISREEERYPYEDE